MKQTIDKTKKQRNLAPCAENSTHMIFTEKERYILNKRNKYILKDKLSEMKLNELIVSIEQIIQNAKTKQKRIKNNNRKRITETKSHRTKQQNKI